MAGDYGNLNKVLSQNVIKASLPHSNGKWSDEKKAGNCEFILDDSATVSWRKGGETFSCTGAELKTWMKEEYGVEVVNYVNDEPDFFTFMDQEIGICQVDEMPTDREKSYYLAEVNVSKVLSDKYKREISVADVRKIMTEKQLTWHECADRKTVIAIPTRINQAFTHMGGIGMEKSIKAIRDEWKSNYKGKLKINKKFLMSTVNVAELNKSIKETKKKYRIARRKYK